MSELLPCPCCGSDRVGILEGHFTSATDQFRAGQSFAKAWCKICQMRTGPEKSRKAAIDTWNRRTSPAGWQMVPVIIHDEQISAVRQCYGDAHAEAFEGAWDDAVRAAPRFGDEP